MNIRKTASKDEGEENVNIAFKYYIKSSSVLMDIQEYLATNSLGVPLL